MVQELDKGIWLHAYITWGGMIQPNWSNSYLWTYLQGAHADADHHTDSSQVQQPGRRRWLQFGSVSKQAGRISVIEVPRHTDLCGLPMHFPIVTRPMPEMPKGFLRGHVRQARFGGSRLLIHCANSDVQQLVHSWSSQRCYGFCWGSS